MQFKATTGDVVKLVSWLVFVILLAATYAILSAPFNLISKALIAGFIWLLFTLCYILSPRKYVTDGFNLMAYSKWQFVFSWPLKEIVSAKLVSEQELGWTLIIFRVFGVGGLFGYYGLFYNLTFGWTWWYASQNKNYVLLELQNGRKVILTPDNPEEFINALK
jgi:hypothetical protein